MSSKLFKKYQSDSITNIKKLSKFQKKIRSNRINN